VFPNPAALLRLSGSVLIEQHDEWEAGERRYFSEASMNKPIEVLNEAVMLPELAAAQTKTTDPHGDGKLHHSAGQDL
jgi:putative transposase